ncbi:MAG: hypothetical protein WCQ70_05950 [Lentimicrobiaceae bacterium]
MIKLNIKLKLITTIVIFLCCQAAIGQQGASTCNTCGYGHYVNLAELSITDSSYQKAYNYYDSAFQCISSPFAKDRYNAIVCSAILGYYDNCKTGILYLLGKGLKREMISDNEAFKEFLLSESGKWILDLKVDPTYNIILRGVYDSIIKADQSFRLKDRLHSFELYKDSILKIDAGNVKLMNELIRKYGWPTEDLIGIESLYTQGYELIIIHQRSKRYKVYDFTEDLKIAYNNCLISANKAQFLIETINGTDSCKVLDAGVVTIVYDSLGTFKNDNLLSFQHKTGFIKLSENKMKEVDINRKKSGLESLDEFRRKIIFSLKDKRFLIQCYGGNSTWTYPVKADYDFNDNILISY